MPVASGAPEVELLLLCPPNDLSSSELQINGISI